MEGRGSARLRTTRGLRRRREWLPARAARKSLVTLVGAVVCIVGVILLPLPGPGMLVIALGLAILSTEYHWPVRLTLWFKREARDIGRQIALWRARRRPSGRL